MTGSLSARRAGWRALPGDLLYLDRDMTSEQQSCRDGASFALAAGYYVLSGQRSDEEVLLCRAGEGERGDWRADGEVFPAPLALLARMVALEVNGAGTDRASPDVE